MNDLLVTVSGPRGGSFRGASTTVPVIRVNPDRTGLIVGSSPSTPGDHVFIYLPVELVRRIAAIADELDWRVAK